MCHTLMNMLLWTRWFSGQPPFLLGLLQLLKITLLGPFCNAGSDLACSGQCQLYFCMWICPPFCQNDAELCYPDSSWSSCNVWGFVGVPFSMTRTCALNLCLENCTVTVCEGAFDLLNSAVEDMLLGWTGRCLCELVLLVLAEPFRPKRPCKVWSPKLLHFGVNQVY